MIVAPTCFVLLQPHLICVIHVFPIPLSYLVSAGQVVCLCACLIWVVVSKASSMGRSGGGPEKLVGEGGRECAHLWRWCNFELPCSCVNSPTLLESTFQLRAEHLTNFWNTGRSLGLHQLLEKQPVEANVCAYLLYFFMSINICHLLPLSSLMISY